MADLLVLIRYGPFYWTLLRDINLNEEMVDDIPWTLTESGQYMAKYAYKAQFNGSTSSPLSSSVLKIWAPPKLKFFAWLAIQNRLWTTDSLANRGDQIVVFIHFASAPQNPLTTSLSIVLSLEGFEALSKVGLDLISWIPTLWKRSSSTSGGPS
jgi:hypothetical protein